MSRRGQSLIEILVAVSVGVLLVVGAIVIISPILRTGTQARYAQVSGALGKELAENVRVLAERDWPLIAELATTSANPHYLVTSVSPFTVVEGTEDVTIATTTYTRQFYLDDVYRNSSGKIDSNGTKYDPSTRKMTVHYAWPQGGAATLVEYLTRAQNEIILQTDWSGGGNQEGPLTSTTTNNRFATSSNIDVTTSTGSLVIDGF